MWPRMCPAETPCAARAARVPPRARRPLHPGRAPACLTRARALTRHRVRAVPDAVHVDPVVRRRADELLRGRVPSALAADHGAAGGPGAAPPLAPCARSACGAGHAQALAVPSPAPCVRRSAAATPRAPRLRRRTGARSEAGSLRPASRQRTPVAPRRAAAATSSLDETEPRTWVGCKLSQAYTWHVPSLHLAGRADGHAGAVLPEHVPRERVPAGPVRHGAVLRALVHAARAYLQPGAPRGPRAPAPQQRPCVCVWLVCAARPRDLS